MNIITYHRESTLENPVPFRFCTVCDSFEQEDKDRPHGIEFHQILLAVEGTGMLYANGNSYALRRGCAFFTARGTPVCYVNTGGLVSAFLTVEGIGADALADSYGKSFVFRENVNVEKYLKDIRAILDGFYGGLGEGKLSALAYSFYTDFFEEEGVARSQLDDVLLYIERHFHQPITLEELASVYRASPSKLSHDFKEKYGIPPLRYVVACRLDYARKLLQGEMQMSVQNVLHAAGFLNASYFVRAYRERFGCTPSEDRKMYAQLK